jgi:hypothetical protein
MTENLQEKFVVCIDNSGFPVSLELFKIYRVVPDIVAESCNDLRVIDESGEDYLYPESRFISIKVPQKVNVQYKI